MARLPTSLQLRELSETGKLSETTGWCTRLYSASRRSADPEQSDKTVESWRQALTHWSGSWLESRSDGLKEEMVSGVGGVDRSLVRRAVGAGQGEPKRLGPELPQASFPKQLEAIEAALPRVAAPVFQPEGPRSERPCGPMRRVNRSDISSNISRTRQAQRERRSVPERQTQLTERGRWCVGWWMRGETELRHQAERPPFDAWT